MSSSELVRIERMSKNERQLVNSLTPPERKIILVTAAREKMARVLAEYEHEPIQNNLTQQHVHQDSVDEMTKNKE